MHVNVAAPRSTIVGRPHADRRLVREPTTKPRKASSIEAGTSEPFVFEQLRRARCPTAFPIPCLLPSRFYAARRARF
jgi:hypothetical protein